jgi:ABC-type sugar transport system, periplasmic component
MKNKVKRSLLSLVLVGAMAVGITGCGTAKTSEPAASEGDSEATEAESDELYIEVSALGSLPYFYDHKMGMEMAGKELGVRTEYVGPAELDMNAMVAAFEQAIAKKPNGILVVGFDPQLEPTIQKATDAGIPVVTLDADLPDSARIAFVGTGNVTAGRMGGEKLGELMEETGKMALIFNPGQSNLEERAAGYREAMEKFPGIEIVEEIDSQQDSAITAQNVATILQKHPDLKGIACLDGASGSGAVTAVREAGLAGAVKIVTMDRDGEVLDGIEEGIVSASVAQQTALMPYYGVQILMNLNRSKIEITSDNAAAGVLGIPAVVDTGVVIIDADNVQYFKR